MTMRRKQYLQIWFLITIFKTAIFNLLMTDNTSQGYSLLKMKSFNIFFKDYLRSVTKTYFTSFKCFKKKSGCFTYYLLLITYIREAVFAKFNP